jgi:hypothetical protein
MCADREERVFIIEICPFGFATLTNPPLLNRLLPRLRMQIAGALPVPAGAALETIKPLRGWN